MAHRESVRFREEQSFSTPLLVGFIALSFVIATVCLVFALIKGDMTAVVYGVSQVLVTLLMGVFFVLVMKVKLVTEVRSDDVRIRFFPFKWIAIPIESSKVEAVVYHPIREYGGWGLKRGRKGMAYNVRGNEGVRITGENGKHILIGSQQAKKLARAIRAAQEITP